MAVKNLIITVILQKINDIFYGKNILLAFLHCSPSATKYVRISTTGK